MMDFKFKIQDLGFRLHKRLNSPVCIMKMYLILCTHSASGDSFSTSKTVCPQSSLMFSEV